ncbi:hypothetical protein CF131_17965 [Aeromonas dhakensis]|nr:hypothetical protein CF131_17965 [Aeromonas dhakensis]TNI39866.1 hypothetical protein CF130_20685 [Aeromonas dhakensis]
MSALAMSAAMANKVILAGVEYLSAYAAALGEDA